MNHYMPRDDRNIYVYIYCMDTIGSIQDMFMKLDIITFGQESTPNDITKKKSCKTNHKN